jgi:Holliday junction resolvase
MASRGRGAKRAGDRYERELATLLGARRQLGAGRQDDVGDIQHNGWAIQVCYRATVTTAVTSVPAKWAGVIEQSARSGLRPALALRWPRSQWRVVIPFVEWNDDDEHLPSIRKALLSDGNTVTVVGGQIVIVTDLSVLKGHPDE